MCGYPGYICLPGKEFLGFGRPDKSDGHSDNQGGPHIFFPDETENFKKRRRGISDNRYSTLKSGDGFSHGDSRACYAFLPGYFGDLGVAHMAPDNIPELTRQGF